ncbi:MAG: hypothetical protein ACKVJU_22080 [Verrucomicrobiales bacterium]
MTLAFAFEPSFERAPTNYSVTKAVTPLTKIADRIANGEPLLNGKTDREVLSQLLALLEIPKESQVIVYSKTSAQNSRISPRTPRAIYFSDNAYFGWVQNGNIEAMTFDEKLGPVFHMVKLREREAGKPIEIARERSCLNCHAGSATRDFPGGLFRSVHSDERGHPIFHAGTFRTNLESPLSERWGGWYVTGTSGKQTHLGNIIATENADRNNSEASMERIDPGPRDGTPYLAGKSSDIVALMIFDHQIHVHNALTQGNVVARQTLYRHAEMRKAFNEDVGKELSETNQKILDGQATKIVRALFSADEFHMGNDGIEGSLEFQKAFTKGALKDDEHRSLRDLRLFDRVFKCRCSYLIYSDVFAHLPDELKSRVLTRIHGVLTNAAAWPDFDYLTSSECHRILNILESTYPD